MATLTIFVTHNYSADALSNIDSILFANEAIAHFAGHQFTAGIISPNVAITGNASVNGMFVNASGSFSMAGWGFSSWSADDTVTVNGSTSADTITGSSQADVIFSGDGSDTVNGGEGNDILVGHTLANLFAQEHDTLNGGNGNDAINGEAADTLSGGIGFDVLHLINDFAMNLDLVASGFEYVVSGFGNDIYTAASGSTAVEVYGSGGDDQITGGSGDDRLWAGVGNDTLVGNDGNDVLVGDFGADSLSGGIGNDRLYVGSEDTSIDGGDGFDAAYIATGTGITLNMATTHLEWVADFTAGGNDAIDGSGVSANLEVYAAGGTDTVIGGSGADFLWGQADNDTIAGNGGNDTLVGGLGVDRLTGGLGTDALYGNSGGGGDGAVDTFVLTNNWGTDFVFDFEIGTDKLDMSGVTGVHSLADLNVSAVDGHAYIAFGSNLIAVADNAGQLTAADFLFNPDFALLVSPPTMTTSPGSPTQLVFGRFFKQGMTDAPGPAANVVAQIGYGNSGTDPRSDPGWSWMTAAFSAQNGQSDEYAATLTGPAGSFAYTYRFGISVGGNPPAEWEYADLSGTGDGFQIGQLGTWTVF